VEDFTVGVKWAVEVGLAVGAGAAVVGGGVDGTEGVAFCDP